MYKLVRESDAVVRQIADTYRANNFITKDISPGVSLAVNEAADHYEVEYTKYDRIYYVLEGQLDIAFDGEKAQLLPGDSCFIGGDTAYTFEGTFKTVVINQPAFGSLV
jgi:ethanolamine utilization protein EutQ (cupin superfamily)